MMLHVNCSTIFLLALSILQSTAQEDRRKGNCYVKDLKYSPIDNIHGQGRTRENSAEACQGRCFSVSGCSYFSFWNDGGCHLSSSASKLVSQPGVTAGSRSCSGNCYVKDLKYSPIDNIRGQGRTHEHSAEACQRRCFSVSGCSYFSFWNDGGCHLSSSAAKPVRQPGVTAGSISCSGTGPFATARSSSTHEKYGPLQSIDGVSFFHSKQENYPWLELKLWEPTEVSDVTIINRKDCCGERLKDAVIRAGMSKVPDGTTNKLLTTNQVCGTYPGPAATGETVKIECSQPIKAEYITIQLKNNGILQIKQVGINFLINCKNEYTDCMTTQVAIKLEGCAKIVENCLPYLLNENIIKDGEIGVNDGSFLYKGSDEENYLKQWATTLTLRKKEGVITRKTNESITINGTINGIVGGKRNYEGTNRRPTGLYAGQGDLITLTFPEELVGKVSVDIGHYKFKLSFPCAKTAICKVGSPYGGLIILWIHTKSYQGTFTVNITNAIRAPTFIYNTSTNQQWKEMIHYSPKWSVLRVPGQVEIFVQTLKIKDITDMEATMERIKATMDALEESIGLPSGSRPGAEVLHLDPGSGGGWHAGICKPGFNCAGDDLYTEDKVTGYTTYYDDFFKDASYNATNGVILHEFGHGFCLGDLPGMGGQWTAETVHAYIRLIRGRFKTHYDTVTKEMINMDLDFSLLYRLVGFTLYSAGKPCGEANFNSKQLVTNAYDNCYKWINWVPERAHGWNVWKDVNTLDAKSTKNYNSNWDRMVDLYCQATTHNMLPLFNLYNVKPSEETINNCEKLPESNLVTKWVSIVKCVNQSMTNGDRDIRDCAKMQHFPENKGLCVITGVCHSDDTNNGNPTTMNNKFDLYGSTGDYMSGKNSSENKENCFERGEDFFQDCKNDFNQPITATFYSKEQGNEINYNEFNFTYPEPGIGLFMSSRLNKNYAAKKCIDGDEDTFCHTENEEYPFFVLGYDEPIEVTDVKVTVRKNCCWERAKQLVVTVTNTIPTRGQLASGLQLGETFIGPASYSAQVITFKSKPGLTGKYVIVQQQYEGVMNFAEVQVNNGTGPFATARSSSTYDNNLEKYGPLQSIDGVSFFHSKQENYPWLELELWEPTEVSDVTIINRKDCCGERLKDAVIRTGMSKVPDGTTNQLLTTNQVCGTYPGPAATGETVKIVCSQPIKAEYITIQLKNNNGILQIKQVGINSE